MVSRARAKRKRQQNWYEENQQRVLKKRRLDYAKNPDLKKTNRKIKYREYPEPEKTAKRIKYIKNPEPKKKAVSLNYRRDPEPVKKAKQIKYNMDPEPKKKAVRNRYWRDPEPVKIGKKIKYKMDPEPKKTAVRKKYRRDPETVKLDKKIKYNMDPEPKKTAVRKNYRRDPETVKLDKKIKYNMDPEPKKTAVRNKYWRDPELEKKRKQMIYRINHRLKTATKMRNIYSYHKRKEEKLASKKLNRNVRLSIKNKTNISGGSLQGHNNYGKIRRHARNCLVLKWLNKENLIRKLTKKIKRMSYTDKLIEARNIVKWCVYAHKTQRRAFLKMTTTLIDQCRERIDLFLNNQQVSERLEVMCGKSKHTSNSEPYYYESSYTIFRNKNKKIILDEYGVATNIFRDFKVHDKRKGMYSWKCNADVCAVESDYCISKMHEIYSSLTALKIACAPKYFLSFNECSNKDRAKVANHIPICYAKKDGCASKMLFLKSIGPHFPDIRNLIRTLYKLRKSSIDLYELSVAFRREDFNYLNNLAHKASKNSKTFITDDIENDKIIDESEIQEEYANAFRALEKRCSDLPIHPCISCEKLLFNYQIQALDRLRTSIESSNTNGGERNWWRELSHIKQNELKNGKICRNCLQNLRKNHLPPTCILNNLHFTRQPAELSCLNGYEKVLIQRAKAFQVVTRMESVAHKKIPINSKLQKVKGRTFHLPLPMEETLKKLPRPEDPLNLSQEFYVLVRGTATKNKVIWESLVDVNKIYKALQFLISQNILYSRIELPDNANELLTTIDKNTIHVMQYDNEEKKKTAPQALLTQVETEKWEEGYQEFTILALHDKRINATDCNLYQMLKVQEEPIDYKCQDIDIRCFPDLFFNGKFGQFDKRNVKLSSAEFIKSRLLSKHPYFRRNQQYLFFLLHDSNIRQLQRGIFHKLNVTNIRERLTADACLQNISDGKLEGNLKTIFSNLRNTPQYWMQPRNDVTCMVYHYGPATWFLTMSPSEWNWDDLRSYLIQVNSDIYNIETKSTCEIIALDPVSVSRFIENKFHGMLDFILSNDHPLGAVTHYFYRREYQGRGLQHFHLLLWVKNAPILGESKNEEVAEFIGKFVTCALPICSLSPTLYQRVTQYQTHNHNSYCLRNKKTKSGFRKMCRFGFPRPVSDSLHLRDVVEAVVSRKTLQSKGRLYDLKRTVREQYINDYNPAILLAWDGNIDIQFIGEKSNILNWYITKYTTKSENSHVGDMFNDISSTKSLSSRLFSLGLRLLNSRECGALEASDTLLGIPLYGTDPDTTIRWLDINMLRRKRLLPINKLKNLEGESTNIFYENWVDDYYPKRPKELENISLYDFSRWYDVKPSPLKSERETYEIGSKQYLIKRQRPYLINHYKFSHRQTPEKYFHSLLIMFKPWRDVLELKENLKTYAESFAAFKDTLLNAVMYDKKLQEIQEALENAKELIEMKKNEVKNETIPDAEGPETGGVFIVNEAGEAMGDMRLIAEDAAGKVKNIEEIQLQLNKDQSRVFDYVTQIVCDNSENKQILRYYVSGVGGTGKSYLIQNLRTWISQKIPKAIVSVSAPTGLSAYNISGITIYRQFQLPVEHGNTPKYRPLSNDVLKLMRDELKDVVLFIIDEISMVSNITLLYIHLRLSEIFGTNDVDDGWFGRKHILLFGDLLQLPPVHEEPPYVDISSEILTKCVGSIMPTNIWVELFKYDELTINMRQAKDLKYAKLLERVRIGTLTVEDIKTLEKRLIPIVSKNAHERLKDIGNYLAGLPYDTTCLCATVHQCNQLNTEMLSRLKANEVKLIARDSIDCRPYMRKKVSKLLEEYRVDCSRTAGMETVIKIKVGAKVMLRRNIDLTKGLVNSAIGEVKEVKYGLDDDVENIVIQFSNGLLHSLERTVTKFEIIDKCFVFRKQFPITLSYGITIHKSQGLSLLSAVMDIGESVFSCAQAYVALSRVTSIEGLHLINLNPKNVKSLKSAVEEYNRLRTVYRPDLPLLQQGKGNCPTYCRDRKWSTKEANITDDVSPTTNQVKTKPANKKCTVQITGFTNDDGVSCYANSAIQCLYACEEVRHVIKFNDGIPEQLKTNLSLYESGILGNTRQIRSLAGEQYSAREQQDVVQFLEDVLQKCIQLQPIFNFTSKESLICCSCNNAKTREVCDRILRIPLRTNLKTLPEMVSATIGHWGPPLGDYTCRTCGTTGQARQKFEITSASGYIVIQLINFDNSLNKISDLKITKLSTAKISIASSMYVPIAAIFHYGTSIHEGHYKSFTRSGEKWICANDDNIAEKRWPIGSKNVYAFILKNKKTNPLPSKLFQINNKFDINKANEGFCEIEEKRITDILVSTIPFNDISSNKFSFLLENNHKDYVLTEGSELEDQVINRFGELLNKFSLEHQHLNGTVFQHQDVLYCYDTLLKHIKPIDKNKQNIQILFGGETGPNIVGHWICTYYDGRNLHIYDSLNNNSLYDKHKIYINKLYPFSPTVIYHKVQQQPNLTDCGVFAIAFAVSLYFKEDPEQIEYDILSMRKHLWNILSENILIKFPKKFFFQKPAPK